MATIKKPAKKYADGGSVTTSTKTTKKPESTVMKPLAKKDRYSSLGGEIGQPPFGGKKPKPGTKVFNGVTGKYDITKKNGGKVTKAKNGKSFPDLNKDGKVTKADILKGRGVIAKSGAKMKKAQDGALTYTNPRGKQYSLPQGASGPLNITRPNGSTRTIENRDKYTKKMKRVFNRNTVDGVRQGTMTDTRQKNGGVTKKAKAGTSMKKCKYGCN